jgi:hypothetical protein
MPPISWAEAHAAVNPQAAGSTTPTGVYSPPPQVGLPPELEARRAAHWAAHGPDPGPCRHPMANPAEVWDGKCAKHRGTRAEQAEQRRWESKAAATVLAQTLGRTSDHVRVVPYDQAAQEDSRLGPAPVVDRVYFVP